MTGLDSLKRYSTVVADTGDIDAMALYKPQDATTNPSLIFKAAQMPEYQSLLDRAIADGRKGGAGGKQLFGQIVDHLLIAFGVEILKIVPYELLMKA